MVVDQLNLEKLGIPTITIATEPFANLAKETARSEGIAELCLMAVPHPMGGIPREEVVAKADTAFPVILSYLIAWQPRELAEEKKRFILPAVSSLLVLSKKSTGSFSIGDGRPVCPSYRPLLTL